MDFLQNHLGLYCPPLRSMTALFAQQVLAGEKNLLKQKQVKRVCSIPQFKVTFLLYFPNLPFRNSRLRGYGIALRLRLMLLSS